MLEGSDRSKLPIGESDVALSGDSLMRMLILLTVVMLSVSTAMAAVSVHVYLADERTPLVLLDPNIPGVYEDVMVGTKLTIFISSDRAETWDGLLWFPVEAWDLGTLSGRGFDEHTHYLDDSCLEAAGFLAQVACRVDDNAGLWMDLFAAGNTKPGDWFVLDYQAQAVGTCYLGLYEFGPDPNYSGVPDYQWPWGYEAPPGQRTLVQTLALNHVPSRDYDGDGLVNLIDFAVLASQWQATSDTDPNTSLFSDLNANHSIDINDITSFCDYWLVRTDASQPTDDSNELGL